MNFQGLHRTIQFSISSLALGKRQKHNISHFFNFANRFLNFFRFFSKPEVFKISRSAKFSVLYQPRCIVAFDAQQKHNISSFLNFANHFLNFFRFFCRKRRFFGVFRRKIVGKPSENSLPKKKIPFKIPAGEGRIFHNFGRKKGLRNNLLRIFHSPDYPENR